MEACCPLCKTPDAVASRDRDNLPEILKSIEVNKKQQKIWKHCPESPNCQAREFQSELCGESKKLAMDQSWTE